MYFTVRQMATKYPMDDTIHTSTELITLDTVRWQLYVLTDSALKLIDSGQSSTLPDISIFCQLYILTWISRDRLFYRNGCILAWLTWFVLFDKDILHRQYDLLVSFTVHIRKYTFQVT